MRKLSPLRITLPLATLAWHRTRGRWLWVAVLVLTLVIAGSVAALGVRLANSTAVEARDALDQILLLNTRAVLWGPGFLAVVAATMHAWKRDRDDGILHVSRAAGHAVGAYLGARTLVLAAWVLAMCLGSVAIVAVAVLGANPSAARYGLLGGLVPAAGFALAGSLLLGVLGSVCLGPRSRPGGYVLLGAMLFLPEVLAPWTKPLLGNDLTSLPALLGGIANAMRPSSFDPARLLTCVAVLAVVLTLLLALLHRSAARWARAAGLPGATH